ncbi:MAG: HAMP domain-containing protein, partial [Nitrospirae bacterium]
FTGIEREGDLYVLKAVSPVYYDQGQLIGTITTGTTMDRAFIGRMEALRGVKIAILDERGSPVLMPEGDVKIPFLSGKEDSLESSGSRYMLMRLPFKGQGGRVLGSFLIMKEDSLPSIMKRAHLRVALLLGLLCLSSVTVTALMLRRVLMPVKGLKEGAELIGKGEFSHRIPVTTRDEIGSLAEVFNRMAENLQRLREMQERLQHSERLASIGRFTAGIAHELNNPIANIIGLLRLIDREIDDKSPLKEDIKMVLSEAGRCGNIVRDLLVYTRQSKPRMEPTNMLSLVNSIVEVVRRGLDGKRVDIEVHCDIDEPIIHVDPVQMEQVVRNLLINAVQAIEGEGRVDVMIGRHADEFVIEVSDTGCGIKEEDRERIFYPFFSTKKAGQGTGLGLTVCYSIVENHGGRIECKPRQERGTTFRVFLPLVPLTKWN